jgi:ankyrin repeat protein
VIVHVFWTQGGDTALMLASKMGHIDCVRVLLEAGADKDAEDNVRYTYYF